MVVCQGTIDDLRKGQLVVCQGTVDELRKGQLRSNGSHYLFVL